MNVRALAWFVGYMGLVGVAAAILLPTVGSNVIAAEKAVERPTSKDALACNELIAMLRDDLLGWYAEDLRTLSPDTTKRGPYPGVLNEWEAARRNGAARCTDESSQKKMDALLAVRRQLEASSYLLSQNAGKDFALLRE